MDRQKSISDIMSKLYLFSNFVKRKSKKNLDDINPHIEIFYRDLLNILFKYELKNETFKTEKSKAVDLMDDINGVAVRVSLDNSIDKVTAIAHKFMEERLYEDFDLKIVIIGNKRKFKVNKVKGSDYTFHMRNNILDNNFFNSTLADKSNTELQAVLDLLDGDISRILESEAKEE